jgi:hypothetical protein
VWIQDGTSGHLLFSDLISNVIYKWTPDGLLSAFLENIYDGPDILNASTAPMTSSRNRTGRSISLTETLDCAAER